MTATPTQPHATDLRPFIPAKDYALSRRFYAALGWTESYADDNIALLERGGTRFYLQAYYQKEWAENTMLHLTVQDAAAWHALAEQVLAGGEYPGARLKEPAEQPYGALVTHLIDPSGVLLHFAQWHSKGA
jgi:hypothetical protein